jgi:hypothetical protein
MISNCTNQATLLGERMAVPYWITLVRVECGGENALDHAGGGIRSVCVCGFCYLCGYISPPEPPFDLTLCLPLSNPFNYI